MLHRPHVHTSAFTLTSCEGDASTQDENELTKLTIAGSGRLDLAPDFGNERRERVVPLTEQCTMCGVVCGGSCVCVSMVMMYGRTPHQPNHDTFFPPLFLYSTSRTPHKQDKSDLLGGRILPAQLHADDGTDVEVDLVPVQT